MKHVACEKHERFRQAAFLGSFMPQRCHFLKRHWIQWCGLLTLFWNV